MKKAISKFIAGFTALMTASALIGPVWAEDTAEAGEEHTDITVTADEDSDEYDNDNDDDEPDEKPDLPGPVIKKQPQNFKFVIEGSDYEAPVYSVTAGMPEIEGEYEVSGYINFNWYIDGELAEDATEYYDEENLTASNEFTAYDLADAEAGVHSVYCETSWELYSEDGENYAYSTDSFVTNFIVCKGVLKNSLLTFSDVDESFDNIGKAIDETMRNNKGMIPGLIVSTGDWSLKNISENDKDAANYNTAMTDHIARMKAQAGGINIVFVPGDFDNERAARDTVIAANLGAERDYNGAGLIYDSRQSKNINSGLSVFGISYSQLVQSDKTISYKNVIPSLEKFLEEKSKNYGGEVIVISSHTGLHTAGVQKESENEDWEGGNEYNPDMSDAMVTLINMYAKKGMNILYLFGHNSSIKENEFLLKPGSTIISTDKYGIRSIHEQKLEFAYGHAGSLTDKNRGKESYTLLTWNNNTINKKAFGLGKSEISDMSYTAARAGVVMTTAATSVTSETTAASTTTSTTVTTSSTKKTNGAPQTGSSSDITYIVIPGLICAAAAVLAKKGGKGTRK